MSRRCWRGGTVGGGYRPRQRAASRFLLSACLVLAASADPTKAKRLVIQAPRHGSRVRDAIVMEIRVKLEDDGPEPDILQEPGTTICLQMEREVPAAVLGANSSSSLGDAEGGGGSRWRGRCANNATAWMLGLCGGSSSLSSGAADDAANARGDLEDTRLQIVGTACYGGRDPRWQRAWWDNYEPTCMSICLLSDWTNPFGMACAVAMRCSAVAMRFTAWALGADGQELVGAARSRFFLAAPSSQGFAFPGGARDGLGNLHINNMCGVDFQGQLAQDALALALRLCKRTGFYVDIGSMDGELNSNTFSIATAGRVSA
eukprot:TRINITY_DN39617_c0_g2_i2.p1 TRINITY_DN39617_c0_g2~~TRINITY_DN39617_c0_g2_i2.p1  ORF type:complete len:317 (-),score=53.84 TRINITY_DN39617_c0_g2_i2:925-1875(-)